MISIEECKILFLKLEENLFFFSHYVVDKIKHYLLEINIWFLLFNTTMTFKSYEKKKERKRINTLLTLEMKSYLFQ